MTMVWTNKTKKLERFHLSKFPNQGKHLILGQFLETNYRTLGELEANQICPLTEDKFLSLRSWLTKYLVISGGKTWPGCQCSPTYSTFFPIIQIKSPVFVMSTLQRVCAIKTISLVGNLPYIFLRNRRCWERGHSSLAECLPGMHRAQSLISSTT